MSHTISFPLTEASKGVFDWPCSGIRILISDY